MFVEALRRVTPCTPLRILSVPPSRHSFHTHTLTNRHERTINAIWGDFKNLTEQEIHRLRNEQHLNVFETPTTTLRRHYESLYNTQKLPAPFYVSPSHLIWTLKIGQQLFRLHQTLEGGIPSQIVVDNGVGSSRDLRRISITQCIKLTNFTQSDKRKKFLPFVEELFLGCEPVQKCVKAYTKGLLTNKKIYNAKTKHLIGSFDFEYDNKNHPIKKSTPTGKTLCRYDNEGNLVEETLVESGLTRQYFYDRTGECSERQEIDSNGHKRIWRYKHTIDIDKGKIQGRCIEETDPEGRTTFRRLDLLGREVETRLPPIQRIQGNPLERVIHRCYDIKNVPDVWNIPQKPDEHHEYMCYDTQGKMSSFGPQGIREFDNLGRLFTAKKFDGKKLVTITRYTYEGFLLASEEHVTLNRGARFEHRWSYRYDTQGRLIEEIWNKTIKFKYFYDIIGRITTKIDWTDPTCTRITNFVFDGPGVSPFAHNGRSHENEISIETDYLPNRAIEILETHIDAWGRPVSKRVINTFKAS